MKLKRQLFSKKTEILSNFKIIVYLCSRFSPLGLNKTVSQGDCTSRSSQ